MFCAAAFLVGLFVNPPYGFAPEDNLAYARVVRMHLAGIAQLEHRYPGATVLSAWPMTDELTRPELGYVKQPIDVARIEDFTPAQIGIAAQEPEKYSAALVFSTKYDPPSPLLSLGAKSEALDEQFFGLHHDLRPETIARVLGAEHWCGSATTTECGSRSSASTGKSRRGWRTLTLPATNAAGSGCGPGAGEQRL